MHNDTIVIITNAPEAYDYESTVQHSTIIPGKTTFGGMNSRQPFRAVVLDNADDGYYARYQQDRYWSGAYLVLTPPAWQQWITDGIIILPEDNDASVS